MSKTKTEVKKEVSKAFNNFGIVREKQQSTNDLYFFELPKYKENKYCSDLSFNSKLKQQFRENVNVYENIVLKTHILKLAVSELLQALILKATKTQVSDCHIVQDYGTIAIIEKLNRDIPNLNLTLEQYKAMIKQR